MKYLASSLTLLVLGLDCVALSSSHNLSLVSESLLSLWAFPAYTCSLDLMSLAALLSFDIGGVA